MLSDNEMTFGTPIADGTGRQDDNQGTAMRSKDDGVVFVPGRRAGFTLFEVLIVMVVTSVLLTVSLPPMLSATRATRLEAARTAFLGDLRVARTEAIRRNRSVQVTRTGPGTYTIEYLGTRTLPEDATFTGGPTTVKFGSAGPMQTGGATYTLAVGGRSTVVVLSPSGFPSSP